VPTRNINLTPELDRTVAKLVKSGRYENASEVMRAALRALEQREKEDEVRLKKLLQDLDEGDASDDFEGDPFAAAHAAVEAHVKATAKRG
jgi:antitoxin ParD1/3/4